MYIYKKKNTVFNIAAESKFYVHAFIEYVPLTQFKGTTASFKFYFETIYKNHSI